MTSGPNDRLFSETLHCMEAGQSVCHLYRDATTQLEAGATPFIVAAVKRQQPCIMLADAATLANTQKILADAGHDGAYLEKTGKVLFVSPDQLSLQPGAFRFDDLVQALLTLFERSRVKSSEPLCLLTDMRALMDCDMDKNLYAACRRRLNALFAEQHCASLCQYDRQYFSPRLIAAALTSYGYVLHDGRLYKNPYAAIEAFGVNDEQDHALLDDMLRFIRAYDRPAASANERPSRHRDYIMAAPTGILVFNDDGYIVEANPAAAAMTGYDAATLAQMHMAHLLLSTDADTLCVQRLSMDNPVVNEVRLQGRHGRLLWTRMHIVTIASGQHIAFFEEIARQKHAEEQLRASEERFRHIAEAAGEYIWETDAALCLTFASPRLGELLKRPLTELLGTTPFPFLPSEDAARIQIALLEAAQTGRPLQQFEHRFQLPDGTTYWLEANARAFYDANGKLAGYRGVSMDISARKAAEEAQRAAQLQLQAILDNMPVGMFEITPDGHVCYINPCLAALFGYASQEELLKALEEYRYIEETVYAHPAEPIRLLREEQRQSGDLCQTYENEFRRKDGTTFSGKVVMVQKPDPVSGNLVRFGFIEEISASKIEDTEQ